MCTDETDIMRQITFNTDNERIQPPKQRKGRPRVHWITQALEDTMEHQLDQVYDHTDDLHLALLFHAANDRLF